MELQSGACSMQRSGARDSRDKGEGRVRSMVEHAAQLVGRVACCSLELMYKTQHLNMLPSSMTTLVLSNDRKSKMKKTTYNTHKCINEFLCLVCPPCYH